MISTIMIHLIDCGLTHLETPMKIGVIAATLAVIAMAAPAFAKPASTNPALAVGKVQAASEGTFIVRNGKLVTARSGQALFTGDRVITRGKARAKVAMKGCTVVMQPTSILPISNSCSEAQSFAPQEEEAVGGAVLGGGEGLSTAALIGIGVGGAGLATGLAIGLSTSP